MVLGLEIGMGKSIYMIGVKGTIREWVFEDLSRRNCFQNICCESSSLPYPEIQTMEPPLINQL